jgi:hypothetical protein
MGSHQITFASLNDIYTSPKSSMKSEMKKNNTEDSIKENLYEAQIKYYKD